MTKTAKNDDDPPVGGKKGDDGKDEGTGGSQGDGDTGKGEGSGAKEQPPAKATAAPAAPSGVDTKTGRPKQELPATSLREHYSPEAAAADKQERKAAADKRGR